ncbi:MAG: hypothetical protein L0Y79_08700 [Chlorobi bacterium]|nr:hypothetical protein [Chlorobiota bacterium]MCI0716387.1 hypothetical protein [Chlorobiota bacterium]
MPKRLFAVHCLLFTLYCLLFTFYTASQERNINDILDYTLTYRGLTREDITIPVEFFTAGEKSPTNDAKLMLPLVKDMLVNPLRMKKYGSPSNETMILTDDLITLADLDLYETLYKIMQFNFANLEFIFHLYGDWLPRITVIYKELIKSKLPLTDRMLFVLKKTKHFQDTLATNFSRPDIEFLTKNILSILEESDVDDPSNFDIFKFNQMRDTSIMMSKMTMDILSKLDYILVDFCGFNSFSMCNNVYKYSKDSLDIKDLPELKNYNNKNLQGSFYYYYYDEDNIRIAIGGPRKNIYTGDFDFIIDFGGDDVYKIENEKSTKNKRGLPSEVLTQEGGFRCIIDLSGNDYYTTSSDFALAGGLLSSSFIFDKEGDDIYESKGAGNLGAAIGGLGLLYDEKGNDTYKGVTFSLGAGCFGVGLIVDREGNDFYIANSYSQGFGMTQGVGAIIDNKGNDSYLVDSRSLDIGRYNDHYVSMCQGYGLGLRPYYAGGIGLIIEGEGNDIYNTDIFGQGGAYWYSLGAIVDKSGHDKYNGYQYSQGAGIHLAVGLLKDFDGWDFYQSNGVSQGCGHDFGFGMLWDVKGNDNYSAYSLSQGAGNADGIGILIDESGVDGYLNKFPSNTRGYGNPRREYGSLGIFLDASGEDYYSNPGFDSTLVNSSVWGVFNDFYLSDLPSQLNVDDFKVPVDTIFKDITILGRDALPLQIIRDYTIPEYFMMAKTLEPRFSLWQEYGFRKLIQDSITTAGFILTKLKTEDHRETQVMRVLSQKIKKSIADALLTVLEKYLSDRNSMTQPEVSFACYIFGETRNPRGKDILLQLTYDDNFKIRSSAVNALGKIKYDTSEVEFIKRVSDRLIELTQENSYKKLYKKDIAFAFNNYKQETNIPVLISLLNDDYYGVRFLVADALENFGDLYMNYINDINIVTGDNKSLNAFLYSLNNLSDENFKSVIEKVLIYFVNSNQPLFENVIDVINHRKSKSDEKWFLDWSNSRVSELESVVKQKVR